MGTTFINLQLKISKEELIKGNLLAGYVCEQTAEEWSSVFEKERGFDWKNLWKLGKKLSKECAVPVIAVSYFDDDEFSMSLLVEGKTAASYSAGMAGSNYRGITKWVEMLGLSKEEASAFRYLVKKELGAGESITVFSRLLGIRMYCDIRFWEEEELDGLWKKDAENVIREIKEEKQRTKVKNRAKAVLHSEISGLYDSLDENTQVLKMVYPDKEDGFEFRHVHCLKIKEDGLEEICDFWYPVELFGKDARRLGMNYEIMEVHVDDGDGCTDMFPLKLYEEKLLSLMQIPEDRLPEKRNLMAVYPLYSHAVDKDRYEYFSRGGIHGINELRKVDLVTSGKQFAVRVQYVRNPDTALCDVRFFDKDLKLLRKEVIDLKIGMNQISVDCSFTYCEENDSIYIGNQKIDLKTGEIITGIPELKEAHRLFIHCHNGKENLLYAVKKSFLYVFDLNLKLISCHRLKGRIMYFTTDDNKNVSLITVGDDTYKWGSLDKKSAVRLYEVMI